MDVSSIRGSMFACSCTACRECHQCWARLWLDVRNVSALLLLACTAVHRRLVADLHAAGWPMLQVCQ